MTTYIGICGYARSGKTELAKAIVKRVRRSGSGASIVPFAGKVKDIARRWFGWDGRKNEPGRRLLQVIGTEAGRAYDPDLWVKWWERGHASVSGGWLIIADDVRFPNEVEAIRSRGGIIVRVDRPGCGPDGHDSERPDLLHTDLVVTNDGTLDDLRAWVPRVLEAAGVKP